MTRFTALCVACVLLVQSASAFVASNAVLGPSIVARLSLSQRGKNLMLRGGKEEVKDSLSKKNHMFHFPMMDFEAAKSLEVCGSWDGWANRIALEFSESEGMWIADPKIKPGRYSFKFIVDGEIWLCNPTFMIETDHTGNANNILEVAENAVSAVMEQVKKEKVIKERANNKLNVVENGVENIASLPKKLEFPGVVKRTMDKIRAKVQNLRDNDSNQDNMMVRDQAGRCPKNVKFSQVVTGTVDIVKLAAKMMPTVTVAATGVLAWAVEQKMKNSRYAGFYYP